MARAELRSIRFVRALMPDGKAMPDGQGQYVLATATSTARLSANAVAGLISQGVLTGNAGYCTPTPEARHWLNRQKSDAAGFADQHRHLSTDGDAITRNLDESPLARLAAPGRGGAKPFLAPHQVEAGERLRHLVERAGLSPRTTMSYDASRSICARSAMGVGDVGDLAIDARRRLNDIARTLPTDCAGVVFDVCGLLKGLQVVESERGWPRRSAKLVLRIGLDQLATFFGLSATTRGATTRGEHFWLEQRPQRFE
ncbi:DUF6456 domain-containing protein [Devosia rhodophyticola]|uniref:DUF6456 domain-containing protein n=1 Tax=Devosia rhodophyticola TaxID=3026423 RepID=A0ABY7YYF1_9HYPH|nr:DUF6456 domain-containing protein [Devosia rhodophyticola]WDR06423.1 DUF6456 domain-containing protein [Devosia rhodophyticola]